MTTQWIDIRKNYELNIAEKMLPALEAYIGEGRSMELTRITIHATPRRYAPSYRSREVALI